MCTVHLATLHSRHLCSVQVVQLWLDPRVTAFRCYWLQLMTNSDTSGKYALIVATPSNVINIWGGVLSLNQVRRWTDDTV